VATISFAGIGGGAIAIAVMKRKLQYTISSLGLLSVAGVPLFGTMTDFRSPQGTLTTWSDPVLWTCIVGAEALVAALLLIHVISRLR